MNTELMFSSATDMWATPADFFARLNSVFKFQLDVCAVPDNAKCPGCGYLIAFELWRAARYDYDCPRCGKHKLSEFQSVYEKPASNGEGV